MERERLLYSISRFDHYFDSVNNKTAVYLAITTFILTASVTAYFQISDIFPELHCFAYCAIAIDIILAIIAILGLITLNILIFASTPFFSQESSSLYYFGGIGTMKCKQFVKISKNRKEADDLNDLRNQVHTLSKGLSNKFKKLKIAGKLLRAQSILVFVLLTILFTLKFLTYGNL
ncbi:Pycsar system effector family protein [Salegentibacter chungangensis]|uniref:Pycsar system effector family protein n=1 Tax=Salegentibacter chungangensis TaxID=1335724 RepID=A0ABW3NR01_9FLAO